MLAYDTQQLIDPLLLCFNINNTQVTSALSAEALLKQMKLLHIVHLDIAVHLCVTQKDAVNNPAALMMQMAVNYCKCMRGDALIAVTMDSTTQQTAGVQISSKRFVFILGQ